MKIIKDFHRLAMAGAVVAGMAHLSTVLAATAVVSVGDGGGGLVYVPAVANIALNDTVTWNWNGSHHSTTSGANRRSRAPGGRELSARGRCVEP